MAKFKAVVKTDFGELHVEADTVKELEGGLHSLGIEFEAGKLRKTAAKPLGAAVPLHPPSGSGPGGQVPDVLIGRLDELTMPDLTQAILYYDMDEATKQQLFERSMALGKPISPEWLDHNMLRDLDGRVVVRRKEGRTAYYGLSPKGRFTAKQRMDELLKSFEQKT